MTIGDKIKKVRLVHKLSQQAFANKIEISASAVAKIESRVNNPYEHTIKLICQELGVNYDWLTGEDKNDDNMLLPREEARAEKLERWLDGSNEFVIEAFYGLANMPVEWWNQAENMLREIFEHKKDRR